MTPLPMTYLDLYEPGTIVRLKNGATFTAGKFWPELPGVDLMADGKRLLTVSECWLKDNVESISFCIPQVQMALRPISSNLW